MSLSVVSQSLPIGFPSRVCCEFSDPMSFSFRQSQKILWSYRAYLECLDCFKNGAFVLFDTLTYSDASLSYFHDTIDQARFTCWDFPCFSRSDLQLFFKRLRKRLKSHYGLNNDAFRYLVTCEYGSEKKTFRPHYHILFFVYGNISPVSFSTSVSAAWWQGLTDGCPHHNSLYVLNNRVFRSVDSHSMNVVQYVTKYITKQFYSYSKLFKRCFVLFSILFPNWQESYSKRLEFNRLKNRVLPFHLQSVGFGSKFELSESLESVLKNDCFTFVYQGKYMYVPISGYFRRKIFFDTFYKNGRLCWCPNEFYLDYLLKNWKNKVSSFAVKLKSFFSNISDDDLNKIAEYRLYRRGVFMNYQDSELSIPELLVRLYSPSRYRLKEAVCGSHYFLHGSFKDSVRFLGRFVSRVYLSNYINISYYPLLLKYPSFTPSRFLLSGSCDPSLLSSVSIENPAFVPLDQFLKVGIDGSLIYENAVYEQILTDWTLEQKRLDKLKLDIATKNDETYQYHKSLRS